MASKVDGDHIPILNRIAVVTGGNKGIGLEICRQLASNGIRVILTARDEKRGLEAVEKLKQSGISNVIFHQLDVTDRSSINSLSEFVKNTFGKLDILMNNAAIAGATLNLEKLKSSDANEMRDGRLITNPIMTQETYEQAAECVDTNYYGVKRVTEALIPLLLLSQSPRIVNLTSYYGKLQFIPNDDIRKEMDDVDRLTEEKIDEIVRSFSNDFKEGDLTKNNWPPSLSAYIVSKVAVSAYTRIIAKKYPAICTNCVHPGYVKTDMSANTGIMSVEEGAEGPIMVALLPHGSPSGLYYYRTVVSSFM